MLLLNLDIADSNGIKSAINSVIPGVSLFPVQPYPPAGNSSELSGVLSVSLETAAAFLSIDVWTVASWSSASVGISVLLAVSWTQCTMQRPCGFV